MSTQESVYVDHRGDIYFTYRRHWLHERPDLGGAYFVGGASIGLAAMWDPHWAIFIAASFVLSGLVTWWMGRTVTVILPRNVFKLRNEVGGQAEESQ